MSIVRDLVSKMQNVDSNVSGVSGLGTSAFVMVYRVVGIEMFNYDGTEFLVAIQSKTDGDAATEALNDVAAM